MSRCGIDECLPGDRPAVTRPWIAVCRRAGFADLTLVGDAGAGISATSFLNTGDPDSDTENSTVALEVENSSVTVDSLIINAGAEGVACRTRSTCTIRDTTIQGGWSGMSVQDQSAGEILGSTMILNSLGTGLGIFGASSVNMRAEPRGAGLPAPVISGHVDPVDGAGIGVFILDGSYLRTDDVTISGNDTGVYARRGVTIKIPGGEVSGSNYNGIDVAEGSTAQIGTAVLDNPDVGIAVGVLTFVHTRRSIFSGNGTDVECSHITAVSNPLPTCAN